MQLVINMNIAVVWCFGAGGVHIHKRGYLIHCGPPSRGEQ